MAKNKTLTADNKSAKAPIRQPIPERGCAFVPIIKPEVKRQFTNTGHPDIRKVENSCRFILDTFSSFDIKKFYELNKHLSFDYQDLTAYFEDWTSQLVKEGKLHKVGNLVNDLDVFEVL